MKKRENQIINNQTITTMAKCKKAEDATAYKKSEIEPLFGLVKQNDKVFIVVGNNVVSANKFDTYESAENYIASKPYELMVNVACVFMNLQNNAQNEKDTKND